MAQWLKHEDQSSDLELGWLIRLPVILTLVDRDRARKTRHIEDNRVWV